jgi:macrodomain Ter protein organizer (MatP/YcbG family)
MTILEYKIFEQMNNKANKKSMQLQDKLEEFITNQIKKKRMDKAVAKDSTKDEIKTDDD